jgi:hypothetical protein
MSGVLAANTRGLVFNVAMKLYRTLCYLADVEIPATIARPVLVFGGETALQTTYW